MSLHTIKLSATYLFLVSATHYCRLDISAGVKIYILKEIAPVQDESDDDFIRCGTLGVR